MTQHSSFGIALKLGAYVGIGLVRLYQWTIRPIIGPRCRFLPHCSDYAIEAIDRHGHPWCQGGLDPVPEVLDSRASQASSQSFSSSD